MTSLPASTQALLFLFTFLLYTQGYTQQNQRINGTVKDNNKRPMSGASISLLNTNELVVNYTFSDQNGNFQLSNYGTGYWLSISYVGYKAAKLKLDTTKKFYEVQLEQEVEMLKEVLIKKPPPVAVEGDTLKYNVHSFSTNEDRTIGDVLKRLPGIETAKDGTIYFNGKKIENLYIDGDDLMDGRYGTATKVIKKELIESVDIINHHQPVSVLKDKIFTDNVALNLVLKDTNSLKLSASATLAVGNSSQAEASAAPILLSRKLKMIGNLAYNNIGTDYRNDFKQLGNSNFVENVPFNIKDVNLSIGTVNQPDVPIRYYYFNRSGFLTINELHKNKKGVQFKFNIVGFLDRNRLSYNTRTTNYLVNDTIVYLEHQRVVNKPLIADAGFHLMVNKSHYFLNNSLKAVVSKDDFEGAADFNSTKFSQGLSQQHTKISNDFTWIPLLKNKGIAEIRWSTTYHSNNQLRNIGSGYFFYIAPQQGYYKTVSQQIQSPSLFSNAYLAYKIPKQRITQEYKLGYLFSRQLLNSNLSLFNPLVTIPYANDLGNNLVLQTQNLYLLAHYQLKFNRFRSDVQLPLTFQQVRSVQPDYNAAEKKGGLYLQPTASFTYNFDNEKYIQASYQLRNAFSDITNIYRGAVLLDYRSLQMYPQSLQFFRTQRSSIAYYQQKSIKLVYFNIGLTYEYKSASAIVADSFSNNVHQIYLVPYPNNQKVIGIYAGFSQYVFRLKAKFGIKMQQQRAITPQLVNSNSVFTQADNFFINISADKKVLRLLEMNYQTGIVISQLTLQDENKIQQQPPVKSFSFDQQFKIIKNLLQNFYVEANGTHRTVRFPDSNKTGFFFLGTTIKKLRFLGGMDAELNCTNLFNVRNYTVFLQNRNQVFNSTYPIRGRTFIIRFNYSF